MMKIYFETIVESSLSDVKNGFNKDLFLALKPWWMPAKLKKFGMELHDEVILEFPLGQSWTSILTSVEYKEAEYFQFIDEGEKLPFPLSGWKHIHRLESISDTKTKIIDNIEFRANTKLFSILIYPLLWYSFKIRESIYCSIFSNNT